MTPFWLGFTFGMPAGIFVFLGWLWLEMKREERDDHMRRMMADD